MVTMFTFGLMTWFFYWSDFFAIRSIAVDGDATEVLITEIETFIGGHIFYVEEATLYQRLVVLEPALESVSLARGIPDKLQIFIRRREPILRLERDGQQWGIDAKGVIFESLPDQVSDVPKVIDQRPDRSIVAGQVYISQETVAWVTSAFRDYIERFGEALSHAVIVEHSRLIDLVTPAGWLIRVDSARPAAGQLANVALILRDHRDKVHEYIDMRVNGWGYLK